MKPGQKIRALRKQKRMTLDELANSAGMSKSYLWELENRETTKPSAEKLNALAQVLDVPVTYFLEPDVAEPRQEHRDEVFFRNYSQLRPEAKEQLRKIMETFRNK